MCPVQQIFGAFLTRITFELVIQVQLHRFSPWMHMHILRHNSSFTVIFQYLFDMNEVPGTKSFVMFMTCDKYHPN